ncbi:MAG: NADH-quinone oxidoreductase subunit I [candidate division Zixibacteria bacterium]|nr:NADH-quinone oxidoreductase subunit I [candidate division Zixibacteria bacterium]
MGVVKDIKNLVKGLRITGKHLGRHAITIQYPEEKWTMPERSRGMVVLLSDKKTGELNCTSCELCMRACPTAAIKIESHRDEKKKRHLDEFFVDVGICCLCGLCEEACNFCAIKLCTKYEYSVLEKDTLLWDKGKLQEMGLDVDYVDTRKKKKPKTATAKPAIAKTDQKPVKDTATDEKQAPEKPSESVDRTDSKPTETRKQDNPDEGNESSQKGNS